MKPLEKVLFLQKSYNLSDHAFCFKFHIKYGLFKKWKATSSDIEPKHIEKMCELLGLDLNDFMSNDSTLCKECMSENQHMCVKSENSIKESEILEDFPREDNSRYEEKD